MIGAGIVGVLGLAGWLNGKFDRQQQALDSVSVSVAQMRDEVGRAWSIQHMQVWTDMYRRESAVPDPLDVVFTVNSINSKNSKSP